ncbi:hypothetical protein RRG08_056951 [Elysia crispata]|uniref:Uncharacterized protein n=1 Tax=Elysia crispata TaxID=231223 RepID=A0AAE0Y593_9GAST|nr:hypothetical protein RRG08_056951 [Elysia crispata]
MQPPSGSAKNSQFTHLALNVHARLRAILIAGSTKGSKRWMAAMRGYNGHQTCQQLSQAEKRCSQQTDPLISPSAHTRRASTNSALYQTIDSAQHNRIDRFYREPRRASEIGGWFREKRSLSHSSFDILEVGRPNIPANDVKEGSCKEELSSGRGNHGQKTKYSSERREGGLQ